MLSQQSTYRRYQHHLAEMHEALNPTSKLLLVEPRLHVGRRDFEKQVAAALEAKLELLPRPSVRLSHAGLLAKGSPITRAASTAGTFESGFSVTGAPRAN